MASRPAGRDAKGYLTLNFNGVGATYPAVRDIVRLVVDKGKSQAAKDKVGENTSVEFPGGLGGKGNEGVAALASRTDGAIGYVEYAYALQNKMTYTQLRNESGAFVAPNSKAFQAAAANADWTKAPGFYLLLTNQPGADSWPITGATFILMHKQQTDPAKAKGVLAFFDWAFRNGGQMAEQLDYVPMPEKVVGLVEQSWKQIVGPDGKPIWTGSGS